jgi:hypothetical protein
MRDMPFVIERAMKMAIRMPVANPHKTSAVLRGQSAFGQLIFPVLELRGIRRYVFNGLLFLRTERHVGGFVVTVRPPQGNLLVGEAGDLAGTFEQGRE